MFPNANLENSKIIEIIMYKMQRVGQVFSLTSWEFGTGTQTVAEEIISVTGHYPSRESILSSTPLPKVCSSFSP